MNPFPTNNSLNVIYITVMAHVLKTSNSPVRCLNAWAKYIRVVQGI